MNSQKRRLLAALLVGQMLLILGFAPVVQCHSEPLEMNDQSSMTKQKITSKPLIVEPLYKFTSGLFNAIGDPKENVIFSPLSIQMAFNMLSLGVSIGGQTEKDILQTLGYSNMTAKVAEIHESNSELRSVFHEIKKASGKANRNPKLDMMNFAIVNKSGVRAEYLNQTRKYYGAVVKQIQNEADQQLVLDEVNHWGKEAGFSNEILPKKELADSTLTLLNAIRVEAFWFEAFYETIIDSGSNSPLYKQGVAHEGTPVAKTGKKGMMAHETMIKFVEFTMNKKSDHSARNARARALQPEHYDELAKLEFRAIKIPLRGDISYTILEPLISNGTSKELAQLEEALLKPVDATNNSVIKLSRVMPILDEANSVAANIRMPGYQYEQKIDLVGPLKSMGLSRIFDVETADLTEMSPRRNLYVDKVIHQAVIEVNEKGIKAAAVTRIMVNLMAILHNEVIEVTIENPFIHVIRLDKVPLFVGHLVKV